MAFKVEHQLRCYWYDPETGHCFECSENDIQDASDKISSEKNKEALDDAATELTRRLTNRGFLFTFDIYEVLNLGYCPNKYAFHSGDWKMWMIHILQEKLRLLGLRRMHEENHSPSRYINEIDKNLEQIREAITAFHQKRPAE